MITQAEIVAFAQAKKASTEASKTLEALKQNLIPRKSEAQEPGPFKLVVDVTPNNSPAYKGVVEAIKGLNAVYTNGGGKPHLLNDKIPTLIEDATEPGRTRTEVKVEANV
jgi:hypothetical protein